MLRHGIKHGPHHIDLFYGTPSPGNAKAQERNRANRFSVTRQLRYSRDETQLALDLGLFINGLPVVSFELKNSLTKQTVEDAVQQYKRDRDPREKLFEFGRCVVHFAIDDHEVRFCTHLKGKASWFLPFNLGWNDGAGNPPNTGPHGGGLKTAYLWKRVLTPVGLTDILENYAQVIEFKDAKTGRRSAVQIWPRFHQLDVVHRLLADVAQHGAGRRYLIQHSAGSGKSNSIAWLAHQLIGLEKDGETVFDSIVVVTDRTILDKQIRDTIKQFAQVGATVGHAEHSGDLRRFIAEGKKIIITTVQKFPFILDEIGSEHRGRRFAIVIDEAHSSQGGKTSAAISESLGGIGSDPEDTVNDALEQRILDANRNRPGCAKKNGPIRCALDDRLGVVNGVTGRRCGPADQGAGPQRQARQRGRISVRRRARAAARGRVGKAPRGAGRCSGAGGGRARHRPGACCGTTRTTGRSRGFMHSPFLCGEGDLRANL